MKKNVIAILIFVTALLGLSACGETEKTVQAIELHLGSTRMIVAPLDTVDYSDVRARVVYEDGIKGPYVGAYRSDDYTFSTIKANGKHTITVTHKSGVSANFEVSIKTVVQIIVEQNPDSRVYKLYDDAYDVGDMKVRLKYDDDSVSEPVRVADNPDFSIAAYNQTSDNAFLVVSYGDASVSLPVLFLDGFDADSGIINIGKIGFVTGPASQNAAILKKNKVSYTDLGISVYDSDNKRHYFFYGDSFPSLTLDRNGFEGEWNSNFCAVSADYVLSDGITFNSVTVPVIQGEHGGDSSDLSGEVTKIPTGGTVINGTVYMFYMSISDWSDWSIRWSGCVKLEGGNWVNVPTLNWVDTTAEQYIDTHPAKISHPDTFNYKSVPSDSFKQITVCSNSPDGYLYLYATGDGRVTDARVMRVRKADFESIDSYEYYCGVQNGAPVWKTAAQNGIADSAVAIDKERTSRSVGELTVTYNPYLQKYMATYCADNFQSGYSNDYYGMVMRLSDTPYGPFDEIYCIDKKSRLIAPGGIYGAFTSEGMMEEDGRVVYLQVSSFTPTYNAQLIKVEFARKK